MFRGQPRWAVRLVIVLAVNAVLGFVPFMAQRGGMRFLPGEGFVAAAELPVVALAIALAVVTVLAATRMMPADQRGALWKKPLQAFPGLMAAVIFVGLPFYQNALVTLPMIATFATGLPTSAEYRIKNDHPRTRGKKMKCQPAVALSGMPFLYDRACHVPEATKAAVDPGDTVQFLGRGNFLGIHFSDARPVARAPS